MQEMYILMLSPISSIKYSNTIYIRIIQILLSFGLLLELYFYLFDILLDVFFLKYQLVLLIVWTIYTSYLIDKNMNTLYFYYLGTLILFIYNRVILDFFGYTDLLTPNFMGYYQIAKWVEVDLLFVLLLYIAFFHLGALSNKNSFKKKILDYDENYYKIGKIFFLIGLFPALYIQYQTFLLYSSASYLDIFTGTIVYEPNTIIKLFASLFRIGFLLILISIPTKKQFLIYTSIFFIFIVLNLLIGVRGYYFAFTITLFWYYNQFYIERVNIFKLFSVFLFVSYIGYVLAQYRLGLDISFDLFEIILKFIYDQGTSILAVMYGIFYKNNLDIEFIRLFDVFMGNKFLIQNEVDILVNESAHLKGFGLGGSTLQEFYLVGGFYFIIIGAYLLGYIVKFFSNWLPYSRDGLFIFLIIMPNIIFSPRARTFDFISFNIKIIILYFIIKYLFIKVKWRFK